MDKTLVLAGNYEQYKYWCREQGLPATNGVVKYIDKPGDITGCGTARVVRTGEWWLNPLHDYPILRLVERGWWMSHETLDCGHKSLSLVWPEDCGAAPWCPFCMIADQEHIIGEFAARLKSFGTILQGEQAQKAVILMQRRGSAQRAQAPVQWRSRGMGQTDEKHPAVPPTFILILTDDLDVRGKPRTQNKTLEAVVALFRAKHGEPVQVLAYQGFTGVMEGIKSFAVKSLPLYHFLVMMNGTAQGN